MKLLISSSFAILSLFYCLPCVYKLFIFADGRFHQSHIYRLTIKKRMLTEDRKLLLLKVPFNFPEISARKGEKSKISFRNDSLTARQLEFTHTCMAIQGTESNSLIHEIKRYTRNRTKAAALL
jgi:hypothetical protein